MTPDHAAIWRFYQFNWWATAAIALALGLGLLLTSFHLKPMGYLIVFGVAGLYGACGHFNATSQQRRSPRIFFSLTAISQMLLVTSLMASITYMATAANRPLMDADLLSLDRMLGLEFRSYLKFIDSRLWLIYILAAGYRAIGWLMVVSVVALSLAGYFRRTGEFILAFTLALVASTVISTFVPAIGVYGALGLTAADFPNIEPQGYYDTLRDAPLLRAGSLRTLDLFELGGVLTFPSFHAASAILYGWAFWPVRLFRPFNLVINGAMILATPVGGGHYFVDVIAGVALAGLCIWVATMVGSAILRSDRPQMPRWMARPLATPMPIADR